MSRTSRRTGKTGTVPIEPFREFIREAVDVAGGVNLLAARLGVDHSRIRAWLYKQDSVRCSTVDEVLVELGAQQLFEELCPEDQIVRRGGFTDQERLESWDRIDAYLRKRKARARVRSERQRASSSEPQSLA